MQVLVNGLVMGSLYVMMALGFSLIFGILQIVNFAHGQFYMVAAFLVYMLYGVWGVFGYLPAVLISAVIVGLFGTSIEMGILRRVREKPIQCLIVTFAIGIAIEQIATLIWGAEAHSIPAPYTGVLRWHSFFFPLDRILAVVYTIVLLSAFYFLLKRTKIGLAMEAVVQNKEAAEIQGIKVNVIYSVSFGIGIFLAAAAGGLIGPIFSLSPYIGFVPMLRAFMAVVLGGLGSVTGAVLGGIIIGLSESFLITYFGGEYAAIMVFTVIMIIMIVKPSGLLGQEAT